MLKEGPPTKSTWRGTIEDLRGVVASSSHGAICARAEGEGSAIADQFIDFGEQNRWRCELLQLAEEMARRVEETGRFPRRRRLLRSLWGRTASRQCRCGHSFQDDRSRSISWPLGGEIETVLSPDRARSLDVGGSGHWGHPWSTDGRCSVSADPPLDPPQPKRIDRSIASTSFVRAPTEYPIDPRLGDHPPAASPG